MTTTVIHYGIQYVEGRRPVGPFPTKAAAEQYLEDNPPHPPFQDPNPVIVERITLTGDWAPVEERP
jgi:hypothetical protein